LRSGDLEHGDRLASIREVADELGADPRTVLNAYQQLVEEGLVEIRARSGVFATGAVPRNGDSLDFPRRWMLETLVGAIERDIPAGWLADHVFDVSINRRSRVAILECNDDQLISMREELIRYFGVEVVSVPLEALVSATPTRELQDVDFIISAGHENLVARLAEQVNKPYVITRVRPALIGRFLRLLSKGPVYFLVTDPRFDAKMRRLIAPMPGSQNLHVLVADRDDLSVIPSGAPTYVMQSVLPILARTRHLGREISAQRIFATETVREILSHILLPAKRSEAAIEAPHSLTT
jgi:hypothetical protein